jgi:hypothetical protein
MTKKEMIKSIQTLEAIFFLNAKQLEFDYGKEESMYRSAINKWLGVNQLMQDLGIKEDCTLPESREAAELICQIYRKKRA